MAYKSRTDSAPVARRDVYAEVTNKIIADLEKGIAPWAKPWNGSGKAPAISMPANATTSRPYSGVNILLLWGALQDGGFTSNLWATFNQIRDAGGMVRKGSKGTMIVYASSFVPENERERAARDGDDARAVPFLKGHTVFNLDQCDGLDHLRTDARPALSRDAFGEMVASLSPVEVRHGGDRAFYAPSADMVQMPACAAFPEPLDYSRTLAHELVHSTGHKSRLDRTFGKRFGDRAYAVEELVAEMGAAFICAAHGVEATTRHADYVGHWLAVLKADNRAIFSAASGATKAAEWLFANAPAPAPEPDGDGDDDGEDDAPTLFPVEPIATPVERVPEPVATAPEPAGNYYAGGRRVVRGGVPCKVFSRKASAEMVAFKARLALAMSGEAAWEGDPAFPLFTFTPADGGAEKAPRKGSRATVPNACPAYYKGGARVMIDGVPMRVASKPTRNRAAMLRECKAFAATGADHRSLTPDECQRRYKAAMREMREAARAEMARVDREAA